MMSTNFRQSFEESNPVKKRGIEKWLLASVDHSQQKKQKVICFKNATSFFHTSLPEIRNWQPVFKTRVLSAIMDRDMKEELVRRGQINWCRNVRYLVPIAVPKDGNCLLHSVAVAVWGITDSSLMIRRLLCLALGVDQDSRFRGRWLYQRQRQISAIVDKLLGSGVETMNQEWQEIRQCLEPPDLTQSMAVTPPPLPPPPPHHRCLEAIHVYTLANILRRPIIVLTDSPPTPTPTTRSTLSGLSGLQDTDMGGIYLPLEWNWTDTCRSPLLLGCSNSHFCPLLFAEHPHKQQQQGAWRGEEAGPERNLAALVNSKFEQLPVRFLLQGEEREAGTLLRKYLRVRETVVQVEGSVQNVLCAEVGGESLPAELNIVLDYVQECEWRFQQEVMMSSSLSSHLPPAAASPAQAGGVMVKEKGHLPGLLPPATPLPPPAHPPIRREQLQGAQAPVYALGDPTLHAAGLGQSQINIPPPSLLSSEQSVSLHPPPEQKCMMPACHYFGDPSLGMMCSKCFRNYTIRDSRNVVVAAAASGSRPFPSAPLASSTTTTTIPPAAAQDPLHSPYLPLSFLNQQCQEKCGFFCSVHTVPYCHECAAKRQRQSQEKMMAASLGQLAVTATNEREQSPALSYSSGGGGALGSQALEEIREVYGGNVAGGMMMKTASAEVQGASPASPLIMGSAAPLSDVSETHPHLPGKTSPLPPAAATTMQMTEEEEAVTCAMVTGEQPEPCSELGSEEPSSQQLFGSGQPSAPPSPHPGHADPAPAPAGEEAQGRTPPSTGLTTTASVPGGGAQGRTEPQDPDLVTPASGVVAQKVLSEPETGEEGPNAQQTPAPEEEEEEERVRQEAHLGAPAQDKDITSAASLARSRRSPPSCALEGAGGEDAKEVCCTNPNCGEPVAHRNLCGKCYMGQGMKTGEGARATEDKTKMPSMQSTSSSAPPSIGSGAANLPTTNTNATANATNTLLAEAGVFNLPESRSQPSSFTDLTHIPAMNYTQSWIQENRFVGSPSSGNVQVPPGPPGPPEGLPEKLESEPLGNDLIASGAGCFSSTQHCIGSGCGNVVPQAGKLCQQCQHILQQARQASGAAAAAAASASGSAQAVPEPLTQAKCRTERCSFFGIPQNLGFCTSCYGKHVERELRPKHHHGHHTQLQLQSPSPSSSSAPRSSHTITVPPDFNYVRTPSEQQGYQCVAAGCRLFGDPKQAGMCFLHYQEHISSLTQAMQGLPAPSPAPASRKPRITSIGYAPEVHITPSSVTIFRTGDTFPPPQVSVPPPPPPQQASRMSSGGSHEPSLGETFYRVASRSSGKCLNSMCTNFGNRSKGGLCNSCAEERRADNDLINRAIYGEEEIG